MAVKITRALDKHSVSPPSGRSSEPRLVKAESRVLNIDMASLENVRSRSLESQRRRLGDFQLLLFWTSSLHS